MPRGEFMQGFSTSYAEYELKRRATQHSTVPKRFAFLAKGKLNGNNIKLVGIIGTIDGKFVFALMSTPVESSEHDLKIFDTVL